MKALTTALMTKFTAVNGGGNHNSFYNDVQGQLFKGKAVDAIYPYAVFMLVSDVPDWTWKADYEDVLIQFSLFSSALSSGEVENMFTHLKELYDDCSLTINGSTLKWMQRQQATLIPEEHTTPDGTVEVWHYAVDYSIMTQKS